MITLTGGITTHSTRAEIAWMSFARLDASFNSSRRVNSSVRQLSFVREVILLRGNIAMSSSYESADLILKLYDLRREEVMRKAREWYTKEFHPQSAQDVVSILRGEHSAYFRMVTSYWEMAASFVNNGAIDWKMFMKANPGEPVNVFVKLYPYLEELRSMFASKYDDTQAFQHLEQVVMKMPRAQEQLAERVEQFKEARARWEAESKKPTA
jgi:hypothetical protein